MMTRSSAAMKERRPKTCVYPQCESIELPLSLQWKGIGTRDFCTPEHLTLWLLRRMQNDSNAETRLGLMEIEDKLFELARKES